MKNIPDRIEKATHKSVPFSNAFSVQSSMYCNNITRITYHLEIHPTYNAK